MLQNQNQRENTILKSDLKYDYACNVFITKGGFYCENDLPQT
jgi:hypothetical protein